MTGTIWTYLEHHNFARQLIQHECRYRVSVLEEVGMKAAMTEKLRSQFVNTFWETLRCKIDSDLENKVPDLKTGRILGKQAAGSNDVCSFIDWITCDRFHYYYTLPQPHSPKPQITQKLKAAPSAKHHSAGTSTSNVLTVCHPNQVLRALSLLSSISLSDFELEFPASVMRRIGPATNGTKAKCPKANTAP